MLRNYSAAIHRLDDKLKALKETIETFDTEIAAFFASALYFEKTRAYFGDTLNAWEEDYNNFREVYHDISSSIKAHIEAVDTYYPYDGPGPTITVTAPEQPGQGNNETGTG